MIRAYLEYGSMESVFRVYNYAMKTYVYLLKYWGKECENAFMKTNV